MSKYSYTYKVLNRDVSRALHRYDMISDGDRILVGLSSGKDSLTLIRPLAFVDDDVIRRFAQEKGCPAFVNPCPTAKVSKRQEIKTFLKQLYSGNKKVKGNIFRAMSHVKTEYLLR